MKQPGIYSIIHKSTGKVYVGQATNLSSRLSKHRSWFNNPVRVINRHLHNYANKYPITDFEFSIVQFCPVEELDSRELFWFEVFKHRTFNTRPNPVTNAGIKRTEEFCVRNKQTVKEYYEVPENREASRRRMVELASRDSWKKNNKAAAVKRMENPEYRKKYREIVQSQENIDKVKTTNFLRGNSKCLAQYTKQGDFVDYFLNTQEAGRAISKAAGNITSALTGRIPSAYGFIWKYISNEEYLKLNNGNILKSIFKIQDPHPIAV